MSRLVHCRIGGYLEVTHARPRKPANHTPMPGVPIMRKLTCLLVALFVVLCGDAPVRAPAAEPCGQNECQSPKKCGAVHPAGWCGDVQSEATPSCCGESECLSNVSQGSRHDSVLPAGEGEINSCWSQRFETCRRTRYCSPHEGGQYTYWEQCYFLGGCYYFELSQTGAIRWDLVCELCGAPVPCYSCASDRDCPPTLPDCPAGGGCCQPS